MTGGSAELLAEQVTQTHEVLADRLARARATRATRNDPRASRSAADPFLASTSRHVAAVNAVLLPAAERTLPDGHQRARDFSKACRRLERAMLDAKGRIYGSTWIRRPLEEIWTDVSEELVAVRAMEEDLAERIAKASHPPLSAMLASRLYRTERRVPTRPHPYLPHRGVAGTVARRVALRVDRFWDTAEGRMIPEPVSVVRTPGRLTDYMRADSHVPPPAE